MTRLLKSAALIALAVLAAPIYAQVPDNIAQIEVRPGWRGADGLHRGALDITLAPGWKTYWRAPGEGGIPPLFNWSGSENLGALEVSFPVPSVFTQNGLRSFVYETRVTLPFFATPGRKGDDITLRGQIELGVCLDICIPVQVNLTAMLPADGVHDPVISEAFEDRPMTAREAGISRVSCAIEPISDGMRVTASVAMAPMASEEVAVMEHPDPSIWVSPASVRRNGNDLIAVADLVPPSAQPFVLSRSSLTITVFSGDRAVEIAGCN